MMISIALFNNKGGVGKTTFLCNLASFLQKEKCKKVLVVDADPQCNTSTYALDEELFYSIYYDSKLFTITDIISPIRQGSGFIHTFKEVKSTGFGFDLIPGNPKFATYEDFLSNDWSDVRKSEIRGIKTNMLFIHFLSLCDKYDYVFFDMGPSLGAINRSVLLACDYFITPMSSDIFSLLALGNIGECIDDWRTQFNKAIDQLNPVDRNLVSDLKCKCNIKFLGYVEQQYVKKSNRAVRAYENILKEIPEEIDEKVVMPINSDNYPDVEYSLGSIPNLFSLVPMSQSAHKPIFGLMNTDGVVGAHYKKVDDFKDLMIEISERFEQNLEDIK